MENGLESTRLKLYPRSLVEAGGMEYGLVQSPAGQRLAVLGPAGSPVLMAFQGEATEFSGRTLLIAEKTSLNVAALRSQLSWLQPRLLGLKTSAGMGDRLGIATPGHVRAVVETQGRVAPIFAQQSIREMTRMKRTPQQVLDDATWGIFEEGWRAGMGADADHLKTTADIDTCLAAGFTFFTIDPGEYVDNTIQNDDLSQLEGKANHLPVQYRPHATGLPGKSFDIEGIPVTFDRYTLLRAVAKYGKAIAHVVSMVEHLAQAAGDRPFEVEVSMDETELPTSSAEHIYIANELKRLGVNFVSFAPRFIGRFEKGVDYIGDLAAFAQDLGIHAAIARQLGPYKLSLHSGSDKFSIYDIFMEQTRGLAHLKTAGTSYLEGLRVVATLDPALMKEIYTFARSRFEADKHSYLISAQLERAPEPDEVTDWPSLLDQFDTREILHVTFGSVLTAMTSAGDRQFYFRLMQLLQDNRELYFSYLTNHFKCHLAPFSTSWA